MGRMKEMQPYPQAPGFTDPGASLAAAKAIGKTRANELSESVYAAIRREPTGMTADEAATALGLSILTVRPRVTELGAEGRIFKTRQRRQNASGASATVWKAVLP